MNYLLVWSWGKQKSCVTLLPFQRFAFRNLFSYISNNDSVRYCFMASFCVLLCPWWFLWFQLTIYFHLHLLLPQSLLQDYQRLLSSMPSRRMNTAKLLENSGEFLLGVDCSLYSWRNFLVLLAACLASDPY